MESSKTEKHKFSTALLSGAIAGMSVDLALFPLDTIKTRLQSQFGFLASGGFKQLYRGLGSAMIVSAPNAAVFFSIYETSRNILEPWSIHSKQGQSILINMISASLGETAACLIRVPVEVIKQRAQSSKLSSQLILKQALREEKLSGLYRGFLSTISRDIPFALIQLPLWEYLKDNLTQFTNTPIRPWESCFCGSIAGLTAALLTNPIDVAKTRIMLARKDKKYGRINFLTVIRIIFKESGFKGLYAGATPRILFITIGGAIYLGGYDFSTKLIEKNFMQR